MRADFVGHATLLIRQGNTSVLTDPWWTSPAYRGQWHPYPIPVPERYDLSSLDAVYISHAHEDHLHRDTLAELLRSTANVEAIIPERYDTAMRDYLGRIGFHRIREVPSGSSATVGSGPDAMRVTVITHMDDSLAVLEAAGEVLVDANDALHSSRREAIEEYCRVLNRRFPRIDYLFCGFGGASYFPNCIQAPGKDDKTVARARETFFLRNFALVAERLRPRHAIPFAAHFVLPDDRTWWISTTRLAMEPPAETARRFFSDPAVEVHDLQPGDYVDDGVVHASPYPRNPDPGAVRAEVWARYPVGPAASSLSDDQFAALMEEIRQRAIAYAECVPATQRLDAVLALWDYPQGSIHVELANGRAEVSALTSTEVEALRPDLVVETRSDLVRSTMRSPFGRDLITIGYAATVRYRSREAMAGSPHDRLLDLLAPAPMRWRQRLRREPRRTISFMLGDPSIRREWLDRLRTRLGLPPRKAPQPVAEPRLYDIGDWAAAAQSPEN